MPRSETRSRTISPVFDSLHAGVLHNLSESYERVVQRPGTTEARSEGFRAAEDLAGADEDGLSAAT